MRNANEELTAQQLADLVGETYTTIDHWSDLELLEFRIRGRERLYKSDRNVFLCKKIRELQNERVVLSKMKQLLKKRGAI